MASSDDEDEALLHWVSNYHFEDDNDEPVSFHVLPIQWSESERQEGETKVPIYLCGKADKGLQKVYMRVLAWKFDLSCVKPVISVLSKEKKKWIVLQRPRKSYEGMVMSALVTVHFLGYVSRNPETSAQMLWDHLVNVFFSLCEFRPAENELVPHMSLIREAIKRDDALANSKFLVNFLKETPTERKLVYEDIKAKKKAALSNDELFDSVCAFCDNGGQLLCCEGRCLRSFHATVKDGQDLNCESLGFTQDEVDAIRKIDFYCKNCQYRQHQCFACGNLGSSDKSIGAEVFPCSHATCGKFYHPRCIANLSSEANGFSPEEFEKKIVLGESFACPIHMCRVCKEGEDKKVTELQFALCRRCPTSYHRKCLPREIPLEKGKGANTEIRGWEGLLLDRILIYCTKHEIVNDIRTPVRDHVRFPIVGQKKNTIEKRKTIIPVKKRRMTTESFVGENSISKKEKFSLKGSYTGKNSSVIQKQKRTSAGTVTKHGTPKSVIANPASKTLSIAPGSLDSARIMSTEDAQYGHPEQSTSPKDLDGGMEKQGGEMPSLSLNEESTGVKVSPFKNIGKKRFVPNAKWMSAYVNSN